MCLGDDKGNARGKLTEKADVTRVRRRVKTGIGGHKLLSDIVGCQNLSFYLHICLFFILMR